ncbi:tetratricopeptide repeat protein [Xanthobacter sp. TB0139]|uniref:tetratricopeptide repeat protein n=1 Tax=Xanthobacter sp. TB0139 TaxID=3459178 RepID=UPI0040396704
MSWLDRLKGKGPDDPTPDMDENMSVTETSRPVLPRQQAGKPDVSTFDITSDLEEELGRALELDLGHEQAAPAEKPTTPASASTNEEAQPVNVPSPSVSSSDDDLMRDALEAAQKGDFETALSIWEPLARSGNSRAQNNIGACFIDGLGVERNYELARQWLELSAEMGDPIGHRNLAGLCLKGLGGPADAEQALSLLRIAAEAGDAPAQDTLSWMLLNGEGAPANPAEALRWAGAAAKQGVPAAMTRLGMIAFKGIPGKMQSDTAEALHWWRKAAKAGDADGQAMLGAAHHSGAGVPRDRVASYAWLLRAKAGGSPLAQRFMEPMEGTLSPEELAAAERRAAVPLAEAEE